MLNEQVLSAGRLSDRRYPIQLKTWLEDVRDQLTRAIKGAGKELERIRHMESSFSRIEGLSPVVERLTDIRTGMVECLNVLQDQNGELDSRIMLIEDLGRISTVWEASDESGDSFLIQLKTWLENVRDMLARAIKGAGNELERIKQMESSFSKIEALSPVLGRLTDIRSGMEECLNILRDQNGKLDSRIILIEDLGRTSAFREACSDVRGREDRPEVQDEAPSVPFVFDFGAETFPDEEQVRICNKKTMTSSLSEIFLERPYLILFSFVLTAVLVTASLTYSMASQSNLVIKLHKSISMLKNELSKSYSVNKELTLRNDDLDKYMADSEARSRELKDKNNELQLALQAANSSLAQSKNDLDAMQASNLRTESEIKAKLLEVADTRTELEGLRHLSEFLKDESGGSLILDPVWLKSGESAQVPEGRITMRLEQASGQDSCSDVIVQLSSNQPGFATLREISRYGKTLCLRLGTPENFRLKNNRCSVLLLGSKTNSDETNSYLVAVFKKK